MKKAMAVVLVALMLGGCSALPGEERAFAVVLGISEKSVVWEAGARIPTYQTGGGYVTISARGNSLGEALALLNASAPMELHYGQLRLLLFGKDLAASAQFPEVLRALSARGEVRAQAALCVTEDNVLDVLDALEPATGSRLSKSLEAMMTSRQSAGVVPSSTMSDWLRMGERQQAVLMNAALENADNAMPGMDAAAGEQAAKAAGKVQLSGGWLTSSAGQVKASLTAMEMQLLSLLQGRLRQGTLSLPEGTATLLEASGSMALVGTEVQAKVRLRYSASNLTEEGLTQALLDALHGLTGKLASAGCDALGVARQAMAGCADLAQWHAMNWPERYPALTWRFVIEVEREA
ncbi:MAG: hypothetical protein IJW85_08265 [Clostridia bacterium]|nr:hypothetical protein [Clostridia bacterium]